MKRGLKAGLALGLTILFTSILFAHEFTVIESSIDQIHSEIWQENVTCRKVIEESLQRIDDLDRRGPMLSSIITINSQALAEADELDRRFSLGQWAGSLHCIPVTVKDNINTSNMPTTGGALKDYQPAANAFVVDKLIKAGAIIISKSNLHEFAFASTGSSLLGGQPLNVYSPNRGPGGSSSGTATSVAASMAVVGVGTDTGGSVRMPASAQGLVGLRPSLRLVSQTGIMPLAPLQDTAGGLCRNVKDCAILLSVIADYDSSSHSGQRLKIDHDATLVSNKSEYLKTTGTHNYLGLLKKNALQGARIGVVKELFGDGKTYENQQVQKAMDLAITKMRQQGAVVSNVKIKDLDLIFKNYKSLARWQFKPSLNNYFKLWPSISSANEPKNFDDVFFSNLFLPLNKESFEFYNEKGTDPEKDPEYILNYTQRNEYVRERLTDALDNKKGKPFDVLLYPAILELASKVGTELNNGDANRLSAFSGFPALTLAAGFVKSEDHIQLPVGMEMLGREFREDVLLGLAYSYEQTFKPRIAPQF